jgi:tetratricopeptide (TPR) repeat protein
MPALQAPKKISRRQELRQDAVVTVTAKAVDYYDKYRVAVVGTLVAVVIAVLAFVGYTLYQVGQSDEAAAHLGAIVFSYEQGRYEEALDGTVDKIGLVEIVGRYGSTDDGNLARYYAGDALYRLGRKDEALKYFEAFDKDDNYLGASAYAAEAAIHEDLGRTEEAADLYYRAAMFYDNALIGPEYLLSAARNYEAVGDYSSARDMYRLIETRYPDSDVAGGLDLLVARLDALQGEL